MYEKALVALEKEIRIEYGIMDTEAELRLVITEELVSKLDLNIWRSYQDRELPATWTTLVVSGRSHGMLVCMYIRSHINLNWQPYKEYDLANYIQPQNAKTQTTFIPKYKF